MATLEKDIERALVRMIAGHGGRCLKWVCPGWLGVPDRLCLLPGGWLIFVETKSPEGSSRGAMQIRWAKWLTDLGFIHRWVYTKEDIVALDALILERRGCCDDDSV